MGGVRLLTTLAAAAVLTACGDDEEPQPAPGNTPANVVVDVSVDNADEPGRDWKRVNDASPGDVLAYRIKLVNRGDRQAPDPRLNVSLTPNLKPIGGTAFIDNLSVTEANADPLPERITEEIDLPPYPPQEVSIVTFRARLERGSARTAAMRARVTGDGYRDAEIARTYVGARDRVRED